MPTYEPANEWAYSILRSVIADKFEATLGKYKVKVGILMARPTREHQPAMKVKGYPISAKIKVLSLEDRVAGQPDARIIIDENEWESMGGMEQEALIAHELYHLELVRVEGEVQTDDAGRPCLKNRPHDVEAGMFREVYEWYGEASIEHKHRQGVLRILDQPRLPFGSDSDPDPDVAHRQRKAEIDAALKSTAIEIANDTLAALISVGYTESQARAAIGSVVGRKFNSVSEMVDAIYQLKNNPLDVVDVDAELIAGSREALAAGGWREIAITTACPGLGTTTTLIWSHAIRTVGELVAKGGGRWSLFANGNEQMQERGTVIDAALAKFRETLPPDQKADFDAMTKAVATQFSPSMPAPAPQKDGDDAWRHLLVIDLHLPEKTLERLQEHEIDFVGELVSLRAKGDLDSILTGQVALDVDDCLERLYGSLPTAQSADMARAMAPSSEPAEPKKPRGRREKVTA